MIKATEDMKPLLQAPAGTFWRWADADVIEWINGSTICYRHDLVGILQQLPTAAVPRLGAVLLVLSACRGGADEQDGILLGHVVSNLVAADPSRRREVDEAMTDAAKLLSVVRELTPSLRSGARRTYLLSELLATDVIWRNFHETKTAIEELKSGIYTGFITRTGPALTVDHFLPDLKVLAAAFNRYGSKDLLVKKLRTGLDQLPEAAEIPELPVLHRSLLEDMEADERTLPMARLTRQVIAVFHLPIHNRGAAEMPLGGISDIINRGQYDRLLMSELAQDEVLLTARLVNNEALYYRREDPPQDPLTQRTVLFDTTLRSWGTPRVLIMSVALALPFHSKHGESVNYFGLGANDYGPVGLATKTEVVEAMTFLDHGMDYSASLRKFFASEELPEQNETILVTEASTFAELMANGKIHDQKFLLDYVVTVDRRGQLVTYECINGITNELFSAKPDIHELFAPGPKKEKPTVPFSEEVLPDFLHRRFLPLLCPKVRLPKTRSQVIEIDGDRIIMVNGYQRLLSVHSRDKGAAELEHYIPRGHYRFHYAGSGLLYLAVYNPSLLSAHLFKINLDESTVDQHRFSFDDLGGKHIAVFFKNRFYIAGISKRFWFNPTTDDTGYEDLSVEFPQKSLLRADDNLAFSDSRKGRMKTDENVMYRIKEVGVNVDGIIQLGQYRIEARGEGANANIWFVQQDVKKEMKQAATAVFKDKQLTANPSVLFNRWQWADGSTITSDNRGFAHFRSSNGRITEFSITMAMGLKITAWASDGKVSGNPMFIHVSEVNIIYVRQFYDLYIRPFIQHIIDQS